MWFQKELLLTARTRGFHLISDEIISQLPELQNVKIGMMNVLIKHTSASLTINENADPSVRHDFETVFNRLIPEDQSEYTHTFEGSDDLPAHIKSSLLGSSLNLPITNGALNLGLWQGIYLCEHRNHGGRRSLLVTINGE
ncbi:MAG: YjbQ family protein [Oceanospirillaceae bacterium]|nr:YjbQ family protein [Oceanospirillaceae bacterium]